MEDGAAEWAGGGSGASRGGLQEVTLMSRRKQGVRLKGEEEMEGADGGFGSQEVASKGHLSPRTAGARVGRARGGRMRMRPF